MKETKIPFAFRASDPKIISAVIPKVSKSGEFQNIRLKKLLF